MVNILIVDDEAGARKTFGNILKAKGYDVDSAGTGQEVDLATLLAYDLDNETREKDTDAKILAALTSIEQRLTALETTKEA